MSPIWWYQGYVDSNHFPRSLLYYDNCNRMQIYNILASSLSAEERLSKEGDNRTGIDTPTANNERTRSAGTKHREIHSSIEKASCGKCTWLRDRIWETYCTTLSNFSSHWTLRSLPAIMTAQATDTLATNVKNKIADIPMVGNPDWTEHGRAEGVMDSDKNWKVVSRALVYEGRMYKEYEYDYRSSFQSCNTDHWWAGPVEFFTRNWESSNASAVESTVSMTGYGDPYKLDIPIQWLMGMAMEMKSSERKQFWRRYRTTAIWLQNSSQRRLKMTTERTE